MFPCTPLKNKLILLLLFIYMLLEASRHIISVSHPYKPNQDLAEHWIRLHVIYVPSTLWTQWNVKLKPSSYPAFLWSHYTSIFQLKCLQFPVEIFPWTSLRHATRVWKKVAGVALRSEGFSQGQLYAAWPVASSSGSLLILCQKNQGSLEHI